MKLIKSPINYTGNKYRILDQLNTFFPKKIDCMVDLFCGGATVGLNINAKKIIFVDNNERIINLLVFLSKQNFDDFIIKCEKIIKKYNLSYSAKHGYKFYLDQCKEKSTNNGLKEYNYIGFYKMRNDYNSLVDKNTEESNLLLYILMIYSFNNDIRFNSDGHFNLPVGKTDLNKMNINKVKEYILRIQSIESEFICASFEDLNDLGIIEKADFIYMDPPYLITNAVYNSGWKREQEYALLDFIDSLIERKVNFALSNILEKIGKVNEPLQYWCYKKDALINIHDINYHYRSSSYNKIKRNSNEKEVLITNKEYK
ncbi:Dam family site-specific DNA-(adenine-N6)-methyltransferase [Mycoplasmopsis gallinacea]|uniref:Site-specific DNA-methyltransferase (adenine-specific) n=1 Tax=Mycoplasmopsis gallinacea TaxID=29556 RepID=A0A6H0V6B3_9BACT|nr:Dam family site-specific DNA-(adenine-N6)-methyltransferase [Mycoplasmopsis gallinacea]QIW62045.1 Dam family site-specific DNA-(adenine-N6)-methyltransferase [Mycoplasmopsis gallinacea]